MKGDSMGWYGLQVERYFRDGRFSAFGGMGYGIGRGIYPGAFGTVFMVSKGVGIHTEAFYTISEWNEGLIEPANAPSWESKIESKEFGLAVGISVFVF